MIGLNYMRCSICGGYSDDGGLRNNQFACHDCLDKEELSKNAKKQNELIDNKIK